MVCEISSKFWNLKSRNFLILPGIGHAVSKMQNITKYYFDGSSSKKFGQWIWLAACSLLTHHWSLPWQWHRRFGKTKQISQVNWQITKFSHKKQATYCRFSKTQRNGGLTKLEIWKQNVDENYLIHAWPKSKLYCWASYCSCLLLWNLLEISKLFITTLQHFTNTWMISRLIGLRWIQNFIYVLVQSRTRQELWSMG